MPFTPPAVAAALSRFTALDLARLPARPFTASSYDEIYAAYMLDLSARLNAAGIGYNVGSLKTDTYAITGRVFAYRVEALETDLDDKVAAVLLPWSWGAYLDGLGANQSPPVARKALVASPRPYVYGTDAASDWQSDDDFRAEIQLAPEALSTCGPEGAYLWFALQVDDVLSAAVYGPMSFGGTKAAPFVGLGEVHIPVLSMDGDGTASVSLVAVVQSAVSAEGRRPIADFVTVSAASVVPWSLDASLYVGPGIDRAVVARSALARVRAVADAQHRPGGSILAQYLYAALSVPDTTGSPVVGYVDLGDFAEVNAGPFTAASPAGAYAAPYCAPGAGDAAVAPITVDDSGATVIAWGSVTVRVVQNG